MDQTNTYEAAAWLMIEAGQLAAARLADLLGRIGAAFARREPWVQAGKYLVGLLSDLPRKNGWTLAEHVGDRSPDRMQRLLNHAAWDEMAVGAAVREFVIEYLGDEFAVAVLDESGQENAGIMTAGVKRQYAGCAGKVTNAVNVVYCTYASPRGHALIGAVPYLPREWTDDPDQRAGAGIPDEVEFATKPRLARDLLADLLRAGQAPPWVTGDEVYGRASALRRFCETHDLGYVFEVDCAFRVQLTAGRRVRADQVVGLLPAQAWNHRSAGPGSKGERRYAWAWVATTSDRHHLLIRRSLTRPTELAYFTTWVPNPRSITLPTLVRVAGMRWPSRRTSRPAKATLDSTTARSGSTPPCCATSSSRWPHSPSARSPHPQCAPPRPRYRPSPLTPTTRRPQTPASSRSPSPRSNGCAIY